ncbi:MMPL family transporter [Aestuariimicrobium sp. T2.26MG-19.2B]|uniref:MMPL family transporter n=1 Tax=Aestuariimicrobium sp. T2.26MG-19.2B TaxID=3040679 RepID=UPI0024778E37|nr:MMPL family transporter [Aestuariimicrobium sp. T2.26MG-19.2B]CAI9404368.1 Apo-petrobactin exporter [Aestuariimicrobium sp. T2.26MG-19.2B]
MSKQGKALTSRTMVGKVGAWVVLVAYLVVFVGLSGVLGSLSTASRDANLPTEAQSRIAAEQLASFPGSDRSVVLLVTTRTDGGALTQADLGGVATVAGALKAVPKPTISEDGKAAITLVPVPATEDDAANKQQVKELRAAVAEQRPNELTMQITGGPAFGADIAASFEGADFTLLAVTVGIVAVLLLITYRSPVLWLIPLVVVGIADRLAQTLTNALAIVSGWHGEPGIVSVLVFGAGTNYALLLISRYREELHRHSDHRVALWTAWRASLGAILASNLTVVGGLMTLLFAALPNTRGLGLASAAGLLCALIAVLVGLPALLAIVGRRIFWPFVPRVDSDQVQKPGVWGAIARGVTARPVVSLVAGLAVLGVFATGLLGVRVGLDQADQFRVASESATGLETVASHFPAGETSPLTVVAASDRQAALLKGLAAEPGVVRVLPTGADEARGRVSLQVTGSPVPGTAESLQLVRDLRTTAAAIDPTAVVGGQTAQDLDQREAQSRDLKVIAPLILLVCFVVVTALTRSAIAPLLLLTVNAASAAAALGAGWWLSRTFIDKPAYAIEVPLFAFLFLVALGIDYTIFLVERIRSEYALRSGKDATRLATVEAVRHTGAVITSAGIVLAAVFAALGVLPLVVMGQLGIIVCLGVLVDTLVVRTVIVPALFTLIGHRIWWPRRRTGAGAQG